MYHGITLFMLLIFDFFVILLQLCKFTQQTDPAVCTGFMTIVGIGILISTDCFHATYYVCLALLQKLEHFLRPWAK